MREEREPRSSTQSLPQASASPSAPPLVSILLAAELSELTMPHGGLNAARSQILALSLSAAARRAARGQSGQIQLGGFDVFGRILIPAWRQKFAAYRLKFLAIASRSAHFKRVIHYIYEPREGRRLENQLTQRFLLPSPESSF